MKEGQKRKKGKFIAVKDFQNENLWREFKAYAVKRGLKAQALEEALKLWIEEQKKREKS